jgi:thioredoxin 1
MSAEIVITAGNFETEVMSSDTPVLVDFWAEWCMPCRMIAPLVEELAGTYAGKLKVGTVNVDEQPDLANRFGIISIPALLVFKNGELVQQKLGAVPKHEIEGLFKNLI